MVTGQDDQLQADILEEAMKEAIKDPNLVSSILHNLGELGVQGQMGDATVANPERDASYITIYSTLDGTPSTILRSMAPKTLRKRLPSDNTVPREKRGQLAFSLVQNISPVVPEYPCILHPENPMREWLDGHGLLGKVCYKKLTSQFSVRRHVETRHKHENAQIKEEEATERDREYREYQRATVELLKERGRRAT